MLEKLVEIGLFPDEIEKVLRIEHDLENYKHLYYKYFKSPQELLIKYRKRISRGSKNSSGYTKLKNNLRQCIRGQIADMIIQNMGRVEDLIGYSIDELILHLESHFNEKINWETRKDWHIDHIKPRSSFKIDQIKECFDLSNLRPLDKIENMKKGRKCQ